MYRISSLIFSCFILLAVSARSQVTKIMYGDSLYMDYHYSCSRDFGFDLKYTLPSGHYEIYRKDSSLTYKYMDAWYKNALKDSTWISYHPSGTISARETYVAGKQNGRQVYYFENGKLYCEGFDTNGAMSGAWFWYNENGIKRSLVTFFNDIKQGTSINYFSDGQMESVENFKDGVFEGICLYFYKNGQLQREVAYKKDQPTGLWKYFNEKGELTKSQQY